MLVQLQLHDNLCYYGQTRSSKEILRAVELQSVDAVSATFDFRSVDSDFVSALYTELQRTKRT